MALSQSASSASHSSPERVSSDQTSIQPERVSSDQTSIEPDPLTQLARETENIEFSTYQSLYPTIKRRHQSLLSAQSSDQYLVFTSVSQAQAARLSSDGSSVSKFCRSSFNSRTGLLIVKIMPLPAHEVVASKIGALMAIQLCGMNISDEEVAGLGSSIMTLGDWVKEPDHSWGPAAIPLRPTFTLEVGLSESTPRLHLDARAWLEIPTSPVNLVLTISINRSRPEVIIRLWERVANRGTNVTRLNPPQAFTSTTIILTRRNNVTFLTQEPQVNGVPTQLTLPFDKVVGRDAQGPLERDFLFSERDLRSLAEVIWRMQLFL